MSGVTRIFPAPSASVALRKFVAWAIDHSDLYKEANSVIAYAWRSDPSVQEACCGIIDFDKRDFFV